MRFQKLSLAATIMAPLCSCAGLSQIQAPVSRFSEASHSASAAEIAFLNAAITIDCEDQFYSAAGDYVRGAAMNFNISGSCTPRPISIAQVATRKALLDSIVLYSDKLLALASAGDDKQLGTNATSLAQNLGKLATSGGVKLSDPSLVQGVEAAFTAIAQMVLDQVKYDDAKQAAQKMQPYIQNVVAALQSENFNIGQEMAGSLGKIEIILKEIVATGPHQAKSSRIGDTFAQLVSARSILASANPLTQQNVASPSDAQAGPGNPAGSVNDSLAALVTGNAAIANTGSGGIYAAANDLYQRATAAKDQYTAISNSK
jgi:hypothetical protein